MVSQGSSYEGDLDETIRCGISWRGARCVRRERGNSRYRGAFQGFGFVGASNQCFATLHNGPFLDLQKIRRFLDFKQPQFLSLTKH
jgi:hypothetical protein